MTPDESDDSAGRKRQQKTVPPEIEDLMRRGEWEQAVSAIERLDRDYALGAPALESLALASYMSGHDDAYAEATARAHELWVAEGALPNAARCAFWVGLTSIFRGEHGKGSGWLSRAERLLERHPAECVEAGYILLPRCEFHLGEGRPERALNVASDAAAIGERFGDPDLSSIARHLAGRARLAMGDLPEGLSDLDEVMISAIEGRLSPIVTGLLYCSVIDVCQTYQILDRASEWTEALSDWCRRQPQLVAFTGRCLIHRSEILMFEGRWADAAAEAGSACQRLADGPSAVRAGQANYYLGELDRLHGRIDSAEARFRDAAALGFDPQPGLALMRLRQGRTREAGAAIRRALAAAGEKPAQRGLLSAAIDIFLATGETDAARACASRLAGLAGANPTGATGAAAAEAAGSLAMSEGDCAAALAEFSRAVGLWRDLGSPYRVAAVRLKTANACAAILDIEGARAEARAAADAFAALGAEPDRQEAEALHGRLGSGGKGLLTGRQIEVLELVARGLTNREIAGALDLSERTVDRHVSDILTRMDVPTRAAAAAFAVASGLISPGGSG